MAGAKKSMDLELVRIHEHLDTASCQSAHPPGRYERFHYLPLHQYAYSNFHPQNHPSSKATKRYAMLFLRAINIPFSSFDFDEIGLCAVIASIIATVKQDWLQVEGKMERSIMMDTAKTSRSMSILSFSLTNVMFVEYICSRVKKKKLIAHCCDDEGRVQKYKFPKSEWINV